MDILDDKRIVAITPYFYHYGLQDIIPLLKNELLVIRQQQAIEEKNFQYKLSNWDIKFDNSFASVCHDTKLFLINKIVVKYPNIAYNIGSACRAVRDRMNKNYKELKKKNHRIVLHDSIPTGINLTQMIYENNKLTFHIEVYKHGNNYRTYEDDVGEFFVILTE